MTTATGNGVKLTVAESSIEETEPDLRVEPLMNVQPLLTALGCQSDAVLLAAGLEPRQFLDGEHRIPFGIAAGLLHTCAKASSCDHFGMLLGQWFTTTQIGIAGQLAEEAPDVHSALRDLINHFDLHDRGGLVTIKRSAQLVSLGYAIKVPDAPGAAQVYDFCVASLCRIMRLLCGLDWNPRRVELSRIQPRNPQPYSDFFRAPVHFDATESAVVFHSRWLDQPLVHRDPERHAKLAEVAFMMREAVPLRFSTRVETIVYRRLARANTAALTAELVGVNERTLHRKLQFEGTSFRKILDEARRNTSCYYLEATALTIKDIAGALGYGGTDAFDHAFRRWFGVSPSRWRQAQPRL